MGGEKKGTTDTNLEYSKLFGFWVPKNILMGGNAGSTRKLGLWKEEEEIEMVSGGSEIKGECEAWSMSLLLYILYYIIFEGGGTVWWMKWT